MLDSDKNVEENTKQGRATWNSRVGPDKIQDDN